MMKTKKSGLLVILALAMVLALSCSAWAADVQTTTLKSTVSGVTVSADKDIEVTDVYGAEASGGGLISIVGYNVTTSGANARGLFANNSSGINMVGDIKTTGNTAYGALMQNKSVLTMEGKITTAGTSAYGAYASTYGSIDMVGDIETTGDSARGAFAYSNSSVDITGNITTQGESAYGSLANESSYLVVTGTITTTGDKATGAYASANSTMIMNGSIMTSGNDASGVLANSSDVTVNGDVSINGTNSSGLSGMNGGTINMNDGMLTIADESSYGMKLEDDSAATLSSVDVVAANLLLTTTSGTLNAEGSELAGDVTHAGVGGTAESLAINLSDSTLEGAVVAIPAIGGLTGGTIDITLENSDWVVTGDSNTNGKVTGDADSAIDYSKAPDGTAVTIDELVGNPTINLKPGDSIGITNSTGNNGNFTSSDPDVIEVVTNPDGSVEIISKGEGDADLTYDYTDENDDTQTVTTGVESSYSENRVTPDASGGDPEDIYEGEAVDIVVDFGSDYTVVGVNGAGLAGSGLSVAVVGGKVELTGTDPVPGSYYYEVTLQHNTTNAITTQRMPVEVAGGNRPTTSSSSSSGCNAGFGILALLGLAFVYKKK